MFASLVGFITIVLFIVLIFARIPRLFGNGGKKMSGMLINMLAAKEIADIALKNNKQNVPDMLSGFLNRNKRNNDTDIER